MADTTNVSASCKLAAAKHNLFSVLKPTVTKTEVDG